MRNQICILILAFSCTSTWATKFPRLPLDQRLKQADNVFVGEVLDVQAIDLDNGQLSDDPEASSAPGSKCSYRLIIRVDQERVFKTVFDSRPRYVVLTYGHKRHLRLRHEKTRYWGKSFILLTDGKNHKTDASFSEPIENEKKVLEHLKANQTWEETR